MFFFVILILLGEDYVRVFCEFKWDIDINECGVSFFDFEYLIEWINVIVYDYFCVEELVES